jgi:hypothetical protein
MNGTGDVDNLWLADMFRARRTESSKVADHAGHCGAVFDRKLPAS